MQDFKIQLEAHDFRLKHLKLNISGIVIAGDPPSVDVSPLSDELSASGQVSDCAPAKVPTSHTLCAHTHAGNSSLYKCGKKMFRCLCKRGMGRSRCRERYRTLSVMLHRAESVTLSGVVGDMHMCKHSSKNGCESWLGFLSSSS